MSTRGAVGFRYKKQDYVHYNHSDSYPSYLGLSVLNFIQGSSLEELQKIASQIVLVSEDETPTLSQIEELENNHCLDYFTEKDDWYTILRPVQGNLNAYKNGLKFMIDGKDFLLDSLFCEYAYIINIDTQTLEFYSGFNQKSRSNRGRYANKQNLDNNKNFYGVCLISKYPLKDILESKDLEFFIEYMQQKSKQFNSRQEKILEKQKKDI